MKKRSFVCLLVAVIVVAIVVSCDMNGDSDDNLPVQTIRWEPDGNEYYQFYTNDSQYYNYGFSTWHDTGDSPPAESEIVIRKISGHEAWGYGMVFDSVEVENRTLVLLNNQGSVTIARLDNNDWNTLKEWTPENSILPGENNRVRVTMGTASNSLTVRINGAVVYHTDDGYTSREGESIGAIAFVGDEDDEDFPNVPIDVRFRITQPMQLP
jgi:hypothetical protein